MHKPVNQENYKDDALYRRVVNAVRHLQQNKGDVTPLNVLLTLGMLAPAKMLEWRQGRIPFLEAVLTANLSITNRVLRILRLHAQDLDMRDVAVEYTSIGRHKNLQFSRAADPNIERAYCRHYIVRIRPVTPPPAAPPAPSAPAETQPNTEPTSEPTDPASATPPETQGS